MHGKAHDTEITVEDSQLGCKIWTHSKDALFLGHCETAHGPEVDVGLATGDDVVGVCRAEFHSQDCLSSALKHTHAHTHAHSEDI